MHFIFDKTHDMSANGKMKSRPKLWNIPGKINQIAQQIIVNWLNIFLLFTESPTLLAFFAKRKFDDLLNWINQLEVPVEHADFSGTHDCTHLWIIIILH